MEEWIGKAWDRWITGAAQRRYPEAAVELKAMQRPLGIYFRALGGRPGLRLAPATEDRHGSRRHWLARVAGSGERLAQARIDPAALRLPPRVDAFPRRELNRDLYFWLAGLAASLDRLPPEFTTAPAWARNQEAARRTLAAWPGLAARYRRLLAAYLPQRLGPEAMPPAEAAREIALRQALTDPGSVVALPAVSASAPPPMPVLLWLAADSAPLATAPASETRGVEVAGSLKEGGDCAHRAERAAAPREKNGMLMMFRAESLLSVAEFFKLNRPTDDDEDPNAAQVAQDLDQLALTAPEAGERIASRVRFDLDLPSAAEDDLVLGPGLRLPEWDYRSHSLREDHVCLQEMASRQASPAPLPRPLARTARRLHRQFAALQPGRRWLKAQPDGSEADLDALVRAHADRRSGQTPDEQLYLSLEKRERDMACLVLADLSLSTDAWVSDEARVIDVIRDALLLFGEALGATGDAFALCGFSSVKRAQVRFHRLKDFGERFDDRVRGRVMAIRPGYYTRIGAAIRRATQLLDAQPATRRILLILSDGKPNDLDHYDGRYGIEDTRAAIREARRRGVVPFCLTIDREGPSYLPHLFGPAGYAVLRKPEELPLRLPLFYAQLTR